MKPPVEPEKFEIEWEDLESGKHYAFKGEATPAVAKRVHALLVSHPKVMNAWLYTWVFKLPGRGRRRKHRGTEVSGN